MKSRRTWDFKSLFDALPQEVRRCALKQYDLWRVDHKHPSLHFKKIGRAASARININYRVLGTIDEDSNTVIWFWIGTHAEYDKLIAGQ